MAATRESPREGAPESGPSLEELSLRGSLAEATTAAYLAALRFQEPGLGAAIKNERKFEDQRRVILAELERLADEETFLAARDGRTPERPAEERPPAGGASQD